MRLSDLKTGQSGVVVKILGHGAFRKRVIEMGFVKGRRVEVVLAAPLKDPVKYSIMGYEVSLRRAEAAMIEVVPSDEESQGVPVLARKPDTGLGDPSEVQVKNRPWPSTVINIALVGNPNCGKTSLFNRLCGSHEHVGNYSGVTVDAKSGTLRHHQYTINVTDLPGTYSLAAYSPEERFVRKFLRDQTPDIILNVVDSSNLERNLYLTTELIDMGRPTVIALNMYDELEESNAHLDYKTLGEMIGVPIVPTVSKDGTGLNELLDTLVAVYEDRHEASRHVHVRFTAELENAVQQIKNALKEYGETGYHFSPRYIAIKLLEGDKETEDIVASTSHGHEVIEMRDRLVVKLEHDVGEDIGSMIAGEKYGFIAGALSETLTGHVKAANDTTGIIDSFVTNKLFGFPLFFAVMLFVFWLTFALGSYPMEWIESGVSWLSELCHRIMPEGPVKDLVADGIIGGVGGVIVFLPNILILYYCISFMEDSGYMARAAFIMDKVMHRLGIHGKSFIPLVMGFGCNVPAILASRSIESRSSRLITILINPFMSCSARLPVYVLLIGTFFPEHGALVFMGLYCLGIAVAFVTAKLLRKFYFKKDETPFVMELPPYRIPSVRTSLRHTWAKGVQYLKKMGGIILFASVIVWALNYFPRHERPAESPVVDTLHAGQTEGNVPGNVGVAESDAMTDTSVADASQAAGIDPQHDSFLEMAGKAINPIMEPLGFHWRATVAALAGVPAKEIVVSTLGVLYTGDEAASEASLGERMVQARDPVTGLPEWDYASAFAFMVFILLYCPCMATIVAIIRETGSWRYGLFSIVYNTAVAWIAALIVYRVALLF